MDQKNYNIFYLIGLAITAFFMLLILITGETSLNFTFIIFFYVVKFLSGFGLVLSIINIFFFIMNKGRDKLSEKATKVLILFQIIVPILLVLYAIYKVYSSYTGTASTIALTGVWADVYSWFDDIIYIYGIASLLLNLYILPLARKEFDQAINMGRNQKLGKNLKQVGRNLKKKWFSYKDQFAKAKVQDQKTIKDVLGNWRNKFAVILLIPLAIGAFILMPITFILIIMWLKIIVFDRTDVYKYEKIGLFISIMIVGLLAIIIPYFQLGIYQEIVKYLWTIDILYLAGIIIASLIFVTKFLMLQGVTISGIKKQRFENKKDSLSEERKKLEAEKKELEELKKQVKTVPAKTESASDLKKKEKKLLEKKLQNDVNLSKKEKKEIEKKLAGSK